MAKDEYPKSPEFAKAAKDVTNLKENASDDSKKRLYALYKIGTSQPGEITAENLQKQKPWPHQLEAKYKWDALVKLFESDGALSPEDAQAKYVEFTNELIAKHGLKE